MEKHYEKKVEVTTTGVVGFNNQNQIALRVHEDNVALSRLLFEIGEMVGEFFEPELIDKISNDIRKLYPGYSLDDIRESFHCAILGQKYQIDLKLYGRPVSLKYFAQVLNLFKSVRAENIKKKEIGKYELDKDAKDQLNKEAHDALVIRVLSLYSTDGDVQEKLKFEIITPIFNFLDKYNLLEKDENVKWGFYFSAKELVKSDALRDKTSIASQQISDPKSISKNVKLKEIQNMIDSLDDPDNATVISKAKRLEVIDFFKRKPVPFKQLKNLIS